MSNWKVVYRVYVFQNDKIIEIHDFDEPKDAFEMNYYYNDEQHQVNQVGAMWKPHFERRNKNATV